MEKSFVTMEQKLCPVCGKEFDSGALLLDRRMRNQFDMHTTTGYDLCPECKAKRDDGYIALVVCDPEKSKHEGSTIKMEDAYRTGEVVHLKKHVAEKIFHGIDLNRPFVFIEPDVVKKLKAMQS